MKWSLTSELDNITSLCLMPNNQLCSQHFDQQAFQNNLFCDYTLYSIHGYTLYSIQSTSKCSSSDKDFIQNKKLFPFDLGWMQGDFICSQRNSFVCKIKNLRLLFATKTKQKRDLWQRLCQQQKRNLFLQQKPTKNATFVCNKKNGTSSAFLKTIGLVGFTDFVALLCIDDWTTTTTSTKTNIAN